MNESTSAGIDPLCKAALSGPLVPVNASVPRSSLPLVLCAVGFVVLVVIIAAVHNFGHQRRPVAPTTTDVGLTALTQPPDVVQPCPPSQNCLNTAEVPSDLSASIADLFPSLQVLSAASVFDARIPEADELQVVGKVGTTRLVFTLVRVRDAAPRAADQHRTRLSINELMIAAQRGSWVISVVVSDGSRVDVPPAVPSWINAAPLPR